MVLNKYKFYDVQGNGKRRKAKLNIISINVAQNKSQYIDILLKY